MIPQLTLQRWREEIGRSVLNLDFRCAGDQPFQAQVRRGGRVGFDAFRGHGVSGVIH